MDAEELKTGLQNLARFYKKDPQMEVYTTGLDKVLADFDKFFIESDTNRNGRLEREEFEDAFAKLANERLQSSADAVCKLWKAYASATYAYKTAPPSGAYDSDERHGQLFDDLLCKDKELQGKSDAMLDEKEFEAGVGSLRAQAEHAKNLQGTDFVKKMDQLKQKSRKACCGVWFVPRRVPEIRGPLLQLRFKRICMSLCFSGSGSGVCGCACTRGNTSNVYAR